MADNETTAGTEDELENVSPFAESTSAGFPHPAGGGERACQKLKTHNIRCAISRCTKGLFLLQPPSVIFPQLQDPEKRFFEVVAEGNVAEVRLFLDEHPDFNINVINFQVSVQTHKRRGESVT